MDSKDEELYLYKVDPDYLKFLHKIDGRVSVKFNNRPFIGLITIIGNITYILPLTSQTTEKRKELGKGKRSARITTFIRDSAEIEIADILYNNMIPVLSANCEKLDIDPEKDTYESNEIRFIRKHRQEIINKAKKVHDSRINQCDDEFLLKFCCDFSLLEDRYADYVMKGTAK
ncbi:MAG: type III toxin-antitoxin system ToxN/AbiQ family toxin [Synergistaceae bacterium]|nr:type III toxin-antitoxin system ToxN/AbiQ family toxin [Synergistaceae bacterium]